MTHYCHACYAKNPQPSGACVRCGESVAPPPGTTYAASLIWALGHPVREVVMIAVQALGQRRERAARGRLRALVSESPDPFLAAQALRSLAMIEGPEPLRGLLEKLARDGPIVLAAAAHDLLRQGAATARARAPHAVPPPRPWRAEMPPRERSRRAER